MADDLVLVGGGLANSLIALRLLDREPAAKIRLIEQGAALGGNHTWSFHTSDLTPAQFSWVQPLIDRSWPHYDIWFPSRQRRISGGYHSITSERLHAVVMSRLGDRAIFNARAARITPTEVELEDGRKFAAPAVVDGRGDPAGRELVVRYQKFVGRVLRLTAPHGLAAPILMDVTIEQRDGFRFIYTLPLADECVLIEDTRYSDSPDLSYAEMRAAIEAYAAGRGWQTAELLREEEGVLPVVLGGDLESYWADQPGVPRSGIRAGLFHYTTGYSLPEAVRLAAQIAATSELESRALYASIRRRSFALWRQGRFFRILNRMLFLAAEPGDRFRILEHFYRLPEPLIHRFYAGRLSFGDKLRILSGKPPVPVTRALTSLLAPLRMQDVS